MILCIFFPTDDEESIELGLFCNFFGLKFELIG